MKFLFKFLRKLYKSFHDQKTENYLTNLKKMGMHIGENVLIVDTFFFDPSHCYLLTIKDNCTICPNVRLIAHDASTKYFLGFTKIGKITIHENSFIGDSTIVLPNVQIGPGAIVGAGSVVTKDVPKGMIAAGNPARIIGSVHDYINKIKSLQKNKKVFNEDYLIQNLNSEKIKEILDSVDNGIGFIV